MSGRKPAYREASAGLPAEWQRLVERWVIPVLTWCVSVLLKVMIPLSRSQRGRSR